MIPVLTGCRCITSGSWPAIPLSRLIFVIVALHQISICICDLLAEKFYDVTNGKTQNPNLNVEALTMHEAVSIIQTVNCISS